MRGSEGQGVGCCVAGWGGGPSRRVFKPQAPDPFPRRAEGPEVATNKCDPECLNPHLGDPDLLADLPLGGLVDQIDPAGEGQDRGPGGPAAHHRGTECLLSSHHRGTWRPQSSCETTRMESHAGGRIGGAQPYLDQPESMRLSLGWELLDPCWVNRQYFFGPVCPDDRCVDVDGVNRRGGRQGWV